MKNMTILGQLQGRVFNVKNIMIKDDQPVYRVEYITDMLARVTSTWDTETFVHIETTFIRAKTISCKHWIFNFADMNNYYTFEEDLPVKSSLDEKSFKDENF